MKTIDLTPEALKTEAGAKRANEAMSGQVSACVGCADILSELFERVGRAGLAKALHESGADKADVQEMVREIELKLAARKAADEELLRSVAGQPAV